MLIPGTTTPITCDVSTSAARPYLTRQFSKTAFNAVHRLSHPGVKATVKLMTQRFVWPSIKADCCQLARACLDCQCSKVSRHVSAPVGSFAPPSSRFEHGHIDLIVMPPSEGQRYCLTMVDRFSRWPDAVPIPDQVTPPVAQAFFEARSLSLRGAAQSPQTKGGISSPSCSGTWTSWPELLTYVLERTTRQPMVWWNAFTASWRQPSAATNDAEPRPSRSSWWESAPPGRRIWVPRLLRWSTGSRCAFLASSWHCNPPVNPFPAQHRLCNSWRRRLKISAPEV